MNICHAFHGLSAYSGIKRPLEILRAAEKIQHDLKEEDLCVADRPIGPLGVILAGTIRLAFDCDVWSYVTESGRRELDGQPEFYLDDPDDDQWANFCIGTLIDRNKKSPALSRHYCEGWMNHPYVVGVWVKDWADEKAQKVARVLARRFSVNVHVVEGTTRVWEICGSMEIRAKWLDIVDPAGSYNSKYDEVEA